MYMYYSTPMQFSLYGAAQDKPFCFSSRSVKLKRVYVGDVEVYIGWPVANHVRSTSFKPIEEFLNNFAQMLTAWRQCADL